MKRVIVAVQNTLVSEVLVNALQKREMLVETALVDTPDGIADLCDVFLSDVLVMDVTRFGSGTFDNRMQTAAHVRQNNPQMRVCLVCDNVSDAELSFRVANARKMGRIDTFFYQSVPSDYIADVIGTM